MILFHDLQQGVYYLLPLLVDAILSGRVGGHGHGHVLNVEHYLHFHHLSTVRIAAGVPK